MIEEDGKEEQDLSSLFTCEKYVEKVFQFGHIRQSLLCSNMTSTDYDLTGQIDGLQVSSYVGLSTIINLYLRERAFWS